MSGTNPRLAPDPLKANCSVEMLGYAGGWRRCGINTDVALGAQHGAAGLSATSVSAPLSALGYAGTQPKRASGGGLRPQPCRPPTGGAC